MEWVLKYGYIGIFMLLVPGIIGLPVPDETIMTFTGYLIYKGKLSAIPAIAAASLGAITGATVNYYLGRTAGNYIIRKFGKRVHLTQDKLDIVHQWFRRFGKWILVIGYFIPGIRHLTSFVAGTSKLEFHMFALFAYSGALLWTTTFISIGYYLGENWRVVLNYVDNHRVVAICMVVIISICSVYAYLKLKK